MKEFDLRVNNRGKIGNKGGTGRPKKFNNPVHFRLTIEKSDLEILRRKYGKRVNDFINVAIIDAEAECAKKRRVLP